MSKPWFGPKTYGYGLSPISLEGWLCMLAYVVVLGATVPVARALGAPWWAAGVAAALDTVAICALAVFKSDGRPWRWRWGGRDWRRTR